MVTVCDFLVVSSKIISGCPSRGLPLLPETDTMTLYTDKQTYRYFIGRKEVIADLFVI